MLTVSAGSTVTATYDALGRMVENNAGGTYTEFVYGPTGTKLAKANGQTLVKAFIALPAAAEAIYNSTGLAYYRHSDWMGSSRLTSTVSRSLYSSSAYAPFGEQYATSGTADASFTGQDQDTVSSLYDFPAIRFSPSQGRWISPNPEGLGAASLTNPQTWNLYGYASGLVGATGLGSGITGQGATQAASVGGQASPSIVMLTLQQLKAVRTQLKAVLKALQKEPIGTPAPTSPANAMTHEQFLLQLCQPSGGTQPANPTCLGNIPQIDPGVAINAQSNAISPTFEVQWCYTNESGTPVCGPPVALNTGDPYGSPTVDGGDPTGSGNGGMGGGGGAGPTCIADILCASF